MRRAGGFTLLEVLVALTIIGVALAALVKIGSDNARGAVYLRDRSDAHWVAMNVMAQVRAGLLEPAAGTRRGSEFLAEHEWYWEVAMAQVRPQVLGRTLEPVWRIEVAVRIEADDTGQPLARLVGYLLP
jgi:general secretion pathway protein I